MEKLHDYTMKWIEAETITDDYTSLTTRQIYCWIVQREYVVLVSKDGTKWQFPGGKPEFSELPAQTISRELKEECGVDLDRHPNTEPKMFGFWVVEDRVDGEVVDCYLQLRYYLSLDRQVTLSPHEPESVPTEDRITIAKWVGLDQAKTLIPWLAASDELRSFKKVAS